MVPAAPAGAARADGKFPVPAGCGRRNTAGMSRIWRRLAWGLLGLVALLALGLVVEHWRGRRLLAATVADLQARGRMPDPKALFAPPGPSNGFDRFIAAAAALGTAYPPPSMQGVAPGRAVESFRFSVWEGRSGPTETWDTFAAWGRTNAAALDQIRHALALPECRPALDWRRGFQLLLPHLSRQKTAAVALSADALLAAREGDREGALANFEALQALEQALAREPLLISQLVRMACAAISWIRVWDVVQRDDWAEADLAELQAALPSADYLPALLRGLQGEAVLWEQTLRTMQAEALFGFGGLNWPDTDLTLPASVEDVPGFAENLFVGFMKGVMAGVVFPLWRFAWQDQCIAFHRRTMDDLIRRGEEAATGGLRLLDNEPPKGLERASGYDRLRYFPSLMVFPGLEKSLTKALRLETERALVETGIALRRHQLRHGRLPERLEELLPDFLAARPKDGMDSQPLRYRLNADGTYTLWSVGEDLEDHGGDSTPNNPQAVTLRWWNARDAVLPLRADDAEFAAWEAAETAKWLKRQSRTGAGATNVPPVLADLMRRHHPPLPATNAPAPAPPP